MDTASIFLEVMEGETTKWISFKEISNKDRKKICYLNQNSQMFNGTLRENLSMYDPSISDDAMKATLKTVGLDHWSLDKPIENNGENLSEGQKRRIKLARISFLRPDIIILDEPEAGLDKNTIKTKLVDFIENLKKNNPQATILLITHSPYIMKYGEDIVIMEDGKVQTHDTITNLIND